MRLQDEYGICKPDTTPNWADEINQRLICRNINPNDITSPGQDYLVMTDGVVN
jgi:hypothetical protein